ncbi:MAG TPA: hypothetical protein VFL99_15720, partial [Segeticoccus sp.]|nr:hypothetical protein [Segeticoccus sp.]
VADAFDSMTTTRSYRPALSVAEALRTLHDRAGSQLDPTCVEALERGLEGQRWEPNQIDDATLARAGSAHDHDDPAVSDLMAAHADELRVRARAWAAALREQVTDTEDGAEHPPSDQGTADHSRWARA